MFLNQSDSIEAPTPVVGKVGQFEERCLQDWNCRKLSTAKISINLSIDSQKPAELNTNAAHRGRTHTKAQTQTSQGIRITVPLEPTAIYTELHSLCRCVFDCRKVDSPQRFKVEHLLFKTCSLIGSLHLRPAWLLCKSSSTNSGKYHNL